MTSKTTSSYQTEHMENIDAAVDLIRENRLFLDDYENSHTLFLLDEHDGRARLQSPIKRAWLATHQDGQVVGCALVCEGGDFTDGSDTVSLFIKPEHRNRGLGSTLLEMALNASPNAWAFYTPEAQSLYEKRGLETAFFSRSIAEEGQDCETTYSVPKPYKR